MVKLCYCELASEFFVIEEGKGCELCCSKEQSLKDFTPHEVNEAFRSLHKEIDRLNNELFELNEAYRSTDIWVDNE